MPCTIRPLQETDIPILDTWFGRETDYRRHPDYWHKLIGLHAKGERTVVVAEKDGTAVGYCTLKYVSEYPPLRDAHIPEINDLAVIPPARKQGVARSIIEYLEQVARERGDTKIGICVGLYADYGQAQRLYAKMNYIPDGQGAFYDNAPCIPGETYRLDDDLIIGFTKEL